MVIIPYNVVRAPSIQDRQLRTTLTDHPQLIAQPRSLPPFLLSRQSFAQCIQNRLSKFFARDCS
jgi:hypothetical protein